MTKDRAALMLSPLGPLAVSLALAVWGRRQQSLAWQRARYLAGIQAAAEMGAVGGSSVALMEHVSRELSRALGLRQCRFQHGAAGLGDPPRLRRDGRVEWHHAVWDVEGKGLPVGSDIELLVESGGRVAVALADQVGATLATQRRS